MSEYIDELKLAVSLMKSDHPAEAERLMQLSKELHEYTQLKETLVHYISPITHRTYLMHAAMEGDSKRVEYLLRLFKELGILESCINLQDRNGPNPKNFTALMHAVAGNHFTVIRLLCEAGAAIDIQATHGCTALLLAIGNNRLDIVRYLHAQGADINLRTAKSNYTPLMCAAERGRTEIVHYLIEQDVDLDVHEYYQSETALTLASGKGYIDIVCALVEAGALLNECSRMGPALCCAIFHHKPHIAHYLIEQDANLDMTYNQSGNTALSLAINAGDLDMVRLLREKGANISTMINGKTLRDIACDIYGANSPIALLLEA